MALRRDVLAVLLAGLVGLGYVATPVLASNNWLTLGFYTYPGLEYVEATISFGVGSDGSWHIFALSCDCSLQGVDTVLVVEGSSLYRLLDSVLTVDYDGMVAVRELRLGGLRLLNLRKYDADKWLMKVG